MNTGSIKNYDSEFCGSIPLNLINQIQAHGILVVLDSDFTIRQVSENINKFFKDCKTTDFLDQNISSFIEAKQLKIIKEKLKLNDKIPLILEVSLKDEKVSFHTLMHVKQDYFILELEQINESEPPNSFANIYNEIKYIMTALKKAASTNELCQTAAEEIKKLSGFDKVLFYKFDKDWNGLTIAEAKEADMEKYLGLHFPASDIPKQARALYLKNPYRLIPDREYSAVKIIPIINPVSNTFTDLSDCNLRSVPAVHIEYLRNMKIVASMSIPIIVNNELWGLISCHHKTAKYPDYEMRSAFELLSNIILSEVSAKENQKGLVYKTQLNTVKSKLVELLYSNDEITEAITSSNHILELLNSTGVAIAYQGQLKTIGKTPSPNQISGIIYWLQRSAVNKVFYTDSLPRLYTSSEDYKETASGLIALPITGNKGDYILGFKPEAIQTVEWGGNPNEAITIENDGKTYHPRNSFSIWQETVKATSAPWDMLEVEAAEQFRTSVLERIIKEKAE